MTRRKLDPGVKRRNIILGLILAIIILSVVALTMKGIYESDFNPDEFQHYRQSEEGDIQ